MSNQIQTKPITKATFTISLAGLANGSGRQSTMINNSGNYPAAIIYLVIGSGSVAPAVNAPYAVYLLRGNDPSSSDYRSDGAGATDAAITIVNAQLLGQIKVTANANTKFYGEFDTCLFGPLGVEWGIAVVNLSGQALDLTEGDHFKGYNYYIPEIQ